MGASHVGTPWEEYGEGPTKIVEGACHEDTEASITAQDFRFTPKGRAV